MPHLVRKPGIWSGFHLVQEPQCDTRPSWSKTHRSEERSATGERTQTGVEGLSDEMRWNEVHRAWWRWRWGRRSTHVILLDVLNESWIIKLRGAVVAGGKVAARGQKRKTERRVKTSCFLAWRRSCCVQRQKGSLPEILHGSIRVEIWEVPVDRLINQWFPDTHKYKQPARKPTHTRAHQQVNTLLALKA